jgi:ribosome-associated protein
MVRRITIPEYELIFSFARSGGPGGQNVNKVETKVTVSFYVAQSGVLTQAEKIALQQSPLIKRQLTAEGALVLSSQRHRSQLRNREDVVERLHDLLHRALVKRRARIATSRTKGSERKRLSSKRLHSQAKAARKRVAGGSGDE